MREHSDWLRVKIDMNISKLLTGILSVFLNREATLGFLKIDSKDLELVTEDIAIF